MLYDFQAGVSMAAGYFGGYTAKMQDVGYRELQRMKEALARKASVEPKHLPQHAFNLYSKRLIKDLEAKGIIRTAVEGLNLAVHADCKDVLRGEFFSTFPRVNFQTSLLLKREEIETRKIAGASVIAALLSSKQSRRAYVEAPFDMLYGYRGKQYAVDLLPPFMMIMHWSMEKIIPPCAAKQNSELTAEGKQEQARSKANNMKPD